MDAADAWEPTNVNNAILLLLCMNEHQAPFDCTRRLWNHLTGEQLADVQLTHPSDTSDAAAADDAAGNALPDSGAAVPASHDQLPDSAAGSDSKPPETDAAGSCGADASEQYGSAAEAVSGAAQQSDAADEAVGMGAEAEEPDEDESAARAPLCPAITALAVSHSRWVLQQYLLSFLC